MRPALNEIGEGLRGRGLGTEGAGTDKGEANELGLGMGVARIP